MELIKGYPYMRKKDLMDEFNVSRTYVDKKVRGIEREVKAGRYNDYAIADSMINVYVFIDYMKYEKALSDANARDYVPDFRPDEIMQLCGFKQKVIELDENTA